MATAIRNGRIGLGSLVVRRGIACILGRVTALRHGKARVQWTEYTSTWTAIGNLAYRSEGRYSRFGQNTERYTEKEFEAPIHSEQWTEQWTERVRFRRSAFKHPRHGAITPPGAQRRRADKVCSHKGTSGGL